MTDDERSPDGELETFAREPSSSRDCVGPYRLVQQIGEGGMGVVSEAEEQHPVRRRVDLKLIKLGMDSKQLERLAHDPRATR